MGKVIEFLAAQAKAEEAGQEEFKCPICGGKAWWGRAEENGHLHCGCHGCGIRIVQ